MDYFAIEVPKCAYRSKEKVADSIRGFPDLKLRDSATRVSDSPSYAISLTSHSQSYSYLYSYSYPPKQE
jgi:hypothetical protein